MESFRRSSRDGKEEGNSKYGTGRSFDHKSKNRVPYHPGHLINTFGSTRVSVVSIQLMK